jgi:hypothetical protein
VRIGEVDLDAPLEVSIYLAHRSRPDWVDAQALAPPTQRRRLTRDEWAREHGADAAALDAVAAFAADHGLSGGGGGAPPTRPAGGSVWAGASVASRRLSRPGSRVATRSPSWGRPRRGRPRRGRENTARAAGRSPFRTSSTV